MIRDRKHLLRACVAIYGFAGFGGMCFGFGLSAWLEPYSLWWLVIGAVPLMVSIIIIARVMCAPRPLRPSRGPLIQDAYVLAARRMREALARREADIASGKLDPPS